jgi:hypothetical protein
LTDPNGGTIPGASVTARNSGTGIATKTTSDTTGNYIFPSLPVGTYSITAEKTGFKTTVLAGITLSVNQDAHVDIHLALGQVSTTIEVNATAPLVQTATASVGTVIQNKQMVDLPLNTRRFGDLAVIVPGTTSLQEGGTIVELRASPFSEHVYVANGLRDDSNNTLVDGVDSREMTLGGFALQPTPDAVQEFKIQTNIYSAVFGKTAGSTINLVTKSGTNQFHGSVYEFLRNDKMDARNFFATQKPEYRRNQYGFAFGGPIQKNKTFFFGNYEELRQIQGSSATGLVPTDDQKHGNFGSSLTGNMINLCGTGGPANLNFDTGQLFDPATESLYTCPVGSVNAGSTITVGQPISGNILTSINPVAQKVMGYFPEPNRPGYPNYVNQTPSSRADHQFDVRLDHTFNSKDQVFGRYLFGQSHYVKGTGSYSSLPGFNDKMVYRGGNLALNWTHTFGPQLLNELVLGFSRNESVEDCAQCPRAKGFVANFGITGLSAPGPEAEGFPYFGIGGFSSIGDSGYRPVSAPDQTEKYQDNLTIIRGRHTIVVGADMQFWQSFREEAPVSPHGQFGFGGQYSSLAYEIPDVGGVSGLADLLLGYPGNGAHTYRFSTSNLVGGTFSNFYVQDDFRISPSLSINIGLRYENRRPARDKRDNMLTFVPTGPMFSGPGNAVLVSALPDAENDEICSNPATSYFNTSDGRCLIATSAQRKQLGFTGRTRETLVYSDNRDFAPRVGLVWRPLRSDRFIVRTGYGIFYDLGNLNLQQFGNSNPLFAPTLSVTSALGPPRTVDGQIVTIDNIFAGGTIPPITQQYLELGVTPYFPTPQVQEWSFGIQSQLARDWAFEANYIGTAAHKLDSVYGQNIPKPGVGDFQSRRPYIDFNTVLRGTADSNSIYNSLQATLTRRVSSGASLLTSYTWAKSIDDGVGNTETVVGNGGVEDPFDRSLNRARSAYDARHRLTVTFAWELPVGQGKRYLNQGRAINRILGGWELSDITTFQTGFPFTVGASNDYANPSGWARPDRLCNGAGPRTLTEWFDASCFSTAALQSALAAGNPRYGNSGRNILNQDGFDKWDFALMKNTRITERVGLQFRAEFYNGFNHAYFGPPDASVGDPNIGKISSAGDPRDIQFGLKLLF